MESKTDVVSLRLQQLVELTSASWRSCPARNGRVGRGQTREGSEGLE